MFLSSRWPVATLREKYSLLLSDTWTWRDGSSSFKRVVSIALKLPSIAIPILSERAVSILPRASELYTILGGVPFLTPLPLPAVVTANITEPDTRKRLVAEARVPHTDAGPTL